MFTKSVHAAAVSALIALLITSIVIMLNQGSFFYALLLFAFYLLIPIFILLSVALYIINNLVKYFFPRRGSLLLYELYWIIACLVFLLGFAPFMIFSHNESGRYFDANELVDIIKAYFPFIVLALVSLIINKWIVWKK